MFRDILMERNRQEAIKKERTDQTSRMKAKLYEQMKKEIEAEQLKI